MIKKSILFIALLMLSISSYSQTFMDQTGLGFETLISASVAWGDYNNNGNLDIFMCGDNFSSNSPFLYKNNGNNTFTYITNPGFQYGVKYSSCLWADFNNDGYLDVLYSGGEFYGSPITVIYKNNGNGTFSIMQWLGFTQLTNSSVACADYNNDGNLDVLISGKDYNYLNHTELYKNNGDGTFTKQTNVYLKAINEGSVSFADYDKDGYQDILVTGLNDSSVVYTQISKLYKNNKDGTFTEQTNINLAGVSYSSAAWCDYDNDGYLDILITGAMLNNPTTNIVSKIYKNNGNGTFSEQTNISINGQDGGGVAWGDYDNDGNSDILISGSTYINTTYYPMSKVFKNNGNNTFTDQGGISLLNLYHSAVAWGDYNNDGMLDILLTGYDGTFRYTKLYKNTFTTPNLSPSVPTNLQYDSINNLIKWNTSTDDHTPTPAITYNLAIGTAGNPNKVKSAQSDLSTGYRYVPAMGNQQLDTFCILNYTYCNFDSIHYAEVQAVDNGFKGSAFSNVISFKVPPLGAISNNDTTIICGTSKQLDIAVVNGNAANLSYSWTPIAGLSNPNLRNPIAKPIVTTWYKVVATSQYGLTFTDSIKITVTPFSLNTGADITKICGDSITFNPTTTYPASANNLSWSWNPTNGLDNSLIKTPKAKPNTTTSYIATTISTEGCMATDTVTFFVNPMLVGLGNDTTLLFGDSIVLNPVINYPGNANNLSWLWAPAATLDNILIKKPKAKPSVTTDYYVNVSSVEGCAAKDTIKVKINYIVIDAGVDITKICGDSVTLSPNFRCYGDTSNIIWSWYPATGLSSTSIRKPKAKPIVTTNYIVSATSLAGYTSIDTIKIIVTPMNVNAGTDITYVCGSSATLNPTTNYKGNPSNLSWSWSPANNLSNTTIKSPLANPIATTMYIVNLTSADGCATTKDTINVIVNPMTANAGTDATIYCGGSYNLYPTTNYPGNVSNLTWTWSPPTGLSSATIRNPLAKPFVTTNYALNLVSTDGCIAKDTIKLSVYPISVDAGYNSTIACGSTTILNPSTNYTGVASNLSYVWSPATGLSSTTIKNPTAKPYVSTIYYVNVSSIEGCTASDSIIIYTIPLAITFNSFAKTCGDSINIGTSINTNSTSVIYSWHPTLGLNNPAILNPIVNPLNTTTYTISAVDGSCNASNTGTVTVNHAIYNPDFLASSTIFLAPPFNALLYNTTPNSSNYNFKWKFGDDTTMYSNNSSVNHTYIYNGSYTVTLIATHKINSCPDSLVKPLYIQCAGGPNIGIEEHSNQNNSYTILPNPFKNELKISSDNKHTKVFFEIFNALGASIYKNSFNDFIFINTKDFPSGIYFIKINDGNDIVTKKIIKE